MEAHPEIYEGPLRKNVEEIAKLKGVEKGRVSISKLADKIGSDPRILKRYIMEGSIQSLLRERGIVLTKVGDYDGRTVPSVIIDPPLPTFLSALASSPLVQRLAASRDLVQAGVEEAIPSIGTMRAALLIKRPPERMVTLSEEGIAGLIRTRLAETLVQHSP